MTPPGSEIFILDQAGGGVNRKKWGWFLQIMLIHPPPLLNNTISNADVSSMMIIYLRSDIVWFVMVFVMFQILTLYLQCQHFQHRANVDIVSTMLQFPTLCKC